MLSESSRLERVEVSRGPWIEELIVARGEEGGGM
jgi:hypothetical protein